MSTVPGSSAVELKAVHSMMHHGVKHLTAAIIAKKFTCCSTPAAAAAVPLQPLPAHAANFGSTYFTAAVWPSFFQSLCYHCCSLRLIWRLAAVALDDAFRDAEVSRNRLKVPRQADFKKLHVVPAVYQSKRDLLPFCTENLLAPVQLALHLAAGA